MSLATPKYDVSINGKGYILLEESYRKKAQPPFNARFSTGDYGYGDLSFWQFMDQNGYTNEGQRFFATKSAYLQSAGWDMRQGKPRLGYGIESVPLLAAIPVPFSANGNYNFDAVSSVVIDWAKWNDPIDTHATVLSAGAEKGIWTGHAASPADAQVGASGLTLPVVGDYSFDYYIRSGSTMLPHSRYFIGNDSGGGYVLEISGINGVTWKLIKTTKNNAWDDTGDTVLATRTATAKHATISVATLSIAAGGVFTIKQDGSALGADVTDATIVPMDSLRFITNANGAGNETTLGNFFIPAPGSAISPSGKFLNYNNKLYIAYQSLTGVAFTFTDLVTAVPASNQPGITHLEATDICLWYRDADPTGALNSITAKSGFMIACANSTVKVYSGQTIAYTHAINSVGGLIVPLSSTTFLVIGPSSVNSGILVIDRFIFTAHTFTLASTDIVHLDGGVSGGVCPSYAFDSSGTLYFASTDLSGTPGGTPSRIFTMTATDSLAASPCISSATTISDFQIRGLASLAGSILLFGAALEGNDTYSAVLKYGGAYVWKSTKAIPISGGTLGELFNYGIPSTWRSSSVIRFLGMNDLDIWDPILEIDSDLLVREVASFNSGQLDTNSVNCLAIAEWNGRFYMFNAAAGTINRTLATRGGLGADFALAVIELSEMAINTRLINKSLYSVFLELSEVLTADATITIRVNGTTIGTMQTADGTIKEILVPAALVSNTFTATIAINQDATWTGYIKNGPALKFIPTQFKKRAWGFAVRTTNNLKLADGMREPSNPPAMISELEAAWASNIPVSFVDLDGVTYSVLVTDFDQRRPLLQRNGGKKLEGFVFLELLEA